MGGVFANGLEISGKAVDAKTIAAMPDVCFTPPENPATPPGVPVPYPSFGMASDTEDGTGTVFIGGKTVNVKNKSYLSKTSGTEAGCAAKKGAVTSNNTGKSYFHKWSNDVKFDGEPVIRNSDLASHNHSSPGANIGLHPHLAGTNVAADARFQTCQEAAAQIEAAVKHIEHEFSKYDPVTDAAGGHNMGGGKLTKPGGHYVEIRQEQNRLNNNLEKFSKSNCFDFFVVTPEDGKAIEGALKEPPTDPSIDAHLMSTYPHFF